MKQLIISAALIFTFGLVMAGGYQVGDKATDFKLKNVDGKMISLSDFPDAKGFIVVFTCNHCPYAKAYEERIMNLDKEFSDKGYPVIAINPNNPETFPEDSYKNMQERAKEKGYTFPYLVDQNQAIYPQYGATRTPHVFVLKKEDGSLIVKYIGAIDDNYADASKVTEKYVENAVNDLLAGKEPDLSFTKAIGCSIK